MAPRSFPLLLRITRHFAAPRVSDVAGACAALVAAADWHQTCAQGGRIAITAGSRGIKDIVPVLQTMTAAVKAAGGQPFIVPSMGSHGGATSRGQVSALSSLGIRERTIGAPIVSSMAVKEVERDRHGLPIWIGADICDADGVIVVNRVKRHTDYVGRVESGLAKMLVVGMGKRRGADSFHQLSVRQGHEEVLLDRASLVLRALPVLFGLAIIENQRDETAELHLVRPEEFLKVEPRLLARANELTPELPFERFDCLILDEIGKDISGGGMDTKVVGRIGFSGSPHPTSPRIGRIFVRDLTTASRGNAIGMGLADCTTTRLLRKIDRRATDINCITSVTPEDGRTPIAFACDKDALKACLHMSGALSAADFTLIWARNTLALDDLVVSENLLECGPAPDFEVVGRSFPLPFDREGNLRAPWPEREEAKRRDVP